MASEEKNTGRLNNYKLKFSAFAFVLFFGLMLISNPSAKSFQKYLREYEKSDSRTTITPAVPPVDVEFTRTNYVLFSSYEVAIDGEAHQYLGIFGTFKKY